MKLILISYLVCGAVVSYCAARALPLPQSFEDPKRYYKPMPMEDNLRGSFNMTPCLREMLACWETIPPEMVCGYWYRVMSICDLRMVSCKDEKGWQFKRDDRPYQFQMWDHDCDKDFNTNEYFLSNAFGGSNYGQKNENEEQKAREWEQKTFIGKTIANIGSGLANAGGWILSGGGLWG